MVVGAFPCLPWGQAALAEERKKPATAVVWRGGGIYFWWYAGVCQQLREEGVDLGRLHHVGCSAGAIAAVLAASGVDFNRAWTVALAHLERNGALQNGAKACAGIWGDILRAFLDEVLPPDAHRICTSLVTVVVSCVGLPAVFWREGVSEFPTRDALLDAVMASAHVPLLLNGNFFAEGPSGKKLLDGSIGLDSTLIAMAPGSTVVMDARKALPVGHVLTVPTLQDLEELVEDGRAHARTLVAQGLFETSATARQ
jgi:predicted acylesterase/phospholipase RssA